MTDKAETVLLPCPFCGGEAEVGDARGLIFQTRCRNCKATGDREMCHQDAIDTWNTRADATRIAELAAQLEAERAKAEDWQAMKDERDGALSGYENLLADTNGEIAGLRARVVELEAFRNGYKDYIRKLQDSVEAERALSDRLAGALKQMDREMRGPPVGAGDGGTYVTGNPTANTWNAARAALTAHTEARKETHDKG